LPLAIVMIALLVPVIVFFVGQPPIAQLRSYIDSRGRAIGVTNTAQSVPRHGFPHGIDRIRAGAVAQVGFIVHLISFLDPVIGASTLRLRSQADGDAVLGRVLFSTVIDRLNQRLASAIYVRQPSCPLTSYQPCKRHCDDSRMCIVWVFRRQPHHIAALIVPARVDPRSFGRTGQPDHGDQSDHLRVRSRRDRPLRDASGAIRCVLWLHRAGN